MKRLLLATIVVSAVGGGVLADEVRPELVNVVVSDAEPTSTGSWRSVLRRSSSAFACGGARCVTSELDIDNTSDETLECQLKVDYLRADGSVARSVATPALVLPRTDVSVQESVVDAELHAEISRLACRARTAYQRIPRGEGCHFQMFGKPFQVYYPPGAVRDSLQGPVIVSFRLGSSEGPAKDVAIAESSLIPVLDQAAMRFVADQLFRTNCAGHPYDLQMRFRVHERLATAAPSN